LWIPKRYFRTKALERAPIISIVTASFDHAGFIERTIRSVLDQKYSGLQYLIQDGGSDDGTTEIVERHRDSLFHYESRKDRGQAHALNLGFERSTGEILGYLNSDDILLPGALNYVADFFSRHPDVDAVYGHRVLIDGGDHEIGRWVLPPHDSRVLSWADYIPQETLFWRRAIWDRAGGYVDESFRFAMDWDLLLRFREAGAIMRRLPRFLGAFRVHRHQKTSADILTVGADEMDRLRKRVLGKPVSEQEIARALGPYVRRHVVYHKLYRLGVLRY
jgi:glycosyltransferase involved in cell wall biosynthesis